MVGTLIRHMIYEQCIGVAFNRAGSNFATVMPIDRVSRLMKKWGLNPSTEFWDAYKNSMYKNMALGLQGSVVGTMSMKEIMYRQFGLDDWESYKSMYKPITYTIKVSE